MKIFEVIKKISSTRLSNKIYHELIFLEVDTVDEYSPIEKQEFVDDMSRAQRKGNTWAVPLRDSSKKYLVRHALPNIIDIAESNEDNALVRLARNTLDKLTRKISTVKESRQQISEGGHMGGVGAIHRSEIEPTLIKLEQDTGLKLRGNTLGSVGKKEFSGDIDVAVSISDEDVPELIARLERSSIVDEAKRGPLVVLSRVEIQGYNPNLKCDRERNGFVQVDFMFDQDIDWLKTFYHAPHEHESRYKGALRNIAIGALSQYVDREEGDEHASDGRPVTVERYMFSSKQGLVRIRRDLKPRKDGKGYTKSHTNTIIDGPWRRADEIAQVLRLGTSKDLNSFETVFSAIEKNHGPKIARRVAQDLARDKAVQAFGLPTELERYL